jgi:hypothetical protein
MRDNLFVIGCCSFIIFRNMVSPVRGVVRRQTGGRRRPSGSDYDSASTGFPAPTMSAVVHITHTFKPNLMDEFVMGITNDHWHIIPQVGPSSPARSINKPSSWTVGNLFPPNAGNPLLPALSVSGGLPFSIYEVEGVLAFSSQPIGNIKNNLLWSVGKHALKFGAFLERLRKARSRRSLILRGGRGQCGPRAHVPLRSPSLGRIQGSYP